MSNPVTHFYVLGEDPEALTGFYTRMFGWATHDHPEPGSTIVQTGAVGDATGRIGPPEADGTSGLMLWADVEDIDATLAAVERLGGRVIQRPYTMTRGPQVATFADPEGNVMGIAAHAHEAFAELKAAEAR